MRKIIHIDMDAFYASVEQHDDPLLKGKPVAVGGAEARGVVAAASYEARKFGVKSAMPGGKAKRLCPELIFVKPRFSRYKEVSKQIRTIFDEYTDLVEPLSLDEAYLDVTRNKKNMPSATIIANDIRAAIFSKTGLTSSAGVSINKFLAKVASDVNKPNGIFVIPPSRVDAFIKELPIEKFYMVGKVTAEKMKELGIYTGADLQGKSLTFLRQHFGKIGSYFFDVTSGKDERAVQPHRDRKSLGAERTFDEDHEDEEVLLSLLIKICEEVAMRVQKAGASGKTITLKIRLADFKTLTRSKSVSHYINTGEEITALSENLFKDTFQPGMKIRLLGVTLSNFNKEQSGQTTIEF